MVNIPIFNGVSIVVSRNKDTDVQGDVLDLNHIKNTIDRLAHNTGNYPSELLVSPEQFKQIQDLMYNLRTGSDIKIGDWVLVEDRIYEVTRLHPLAGVNIENNKHRGISILKAIRVPKGGNPDYIRTLYGQSED